jgi:predicted nucleic acid-binding protein
VSLILDTGPIVAALNKADRDHIRCAALIEGAADLLIPSPVLVEVDYWLIKLAGPDVWSNFVADILRGAYGVVHPTESDIERAAELESDYPTLGLGFVDASVIAICERLGETRVATLDRRHYSVVRPRHCEHLSLLPE